LIDAGKDASKTPRQMALCYTTTDKIMPHSRQAELRIDT
jgi:hypothetical protein